MAPSQLASPRRTELFGVLRLALAITVVIYHLTWATRSVPIGISAVIVFFIISGYAMSGLARSWRFMERGEIGGYLLDRVTRIMPQYLFWLATAFVLATIGFWPPLTFPVPLDLQTLLLNVALLPVMLARILPIGLPSPLIPQSWSLGTELIFYALFPLILRGRRLAILLTGVSLLLFAAGILGAIPMTAFVYIAPCGTLPFFVLGHALHRRDLRLAAWIVVLALCPLLVSAVRGTLGQQPVVNVDTGVLVGILVGPPLVFLAARGARFPASLDRRLGDLAFGVYLSQDAVIGLLLPMRQPFSVLCVATLLIVTINGWLGWTLIDRPIASWRRRRRRGGAERIPVPSLCPEVTATAGQGLPG